MSMETIQAKKEYIDRPELGMTVFHDSIYKGRELMTIVGIRKHEVELEGDYSGGTHNILQKSWLPIEGAFRLRKICDNYVKYNTCPLPNVHCGFPGCEPYLTNYGHYVDGKLVDEVILKL